MINIEAQCNVKRPCPVTTDQVASTHQGCPIPGFAATSDDHRMQTPRIGYPVEVRETRSGPGIPYPECGVPSLLGCFQGRSALLFRANTLYEFFVAVIHRFPIAVRHDSSGPFGPPSPFSTPFLQPEKPPMVHFWIGSDGAGTPLPDRKKRPPCWQSIPASSAPDQAP